MEGIEPPASRLTGDNHSLTVDHSTKDANDVLGALTTELHRETGPSEWTRTIDRPS